MSAARPVSLATVERRAMLALAGREMRRVISLWTQTIVPPVVTGAIFLAVFGGALGDRLQVVQDVAYVQFILPGLLVMTVASQAFANNSTSLFQAKNEGYIEDVLTSPLRNWQLALAYMTGGLLRAWLAAAALAALALPFIGAVPDPALTVLALGLTGLVFAPLGVITGIWAESFDQHAFIANLVIAPLALLAGVFYSAERLDQPWATLTRADPIYYLVDAARQGVAGVSDGNAAVALLVAAAVAAALFAAAVALLRTGWRLKP
jgi:ABC-2 type transport system permease protein